MYPADHPDADRKVPALTSNTEGKIRSIQVRFVIDADDPPLAVGDLININGHFTAHPPDAARES